MTYITRERRIRGKRRRRGEGVSRGGKGEVRVGQGGKERKRRERKK